MFTAWPPVYDDLSGTKSTVNLWVLPLVATIATSNLNLEPSKGSRPPAMGLRRRSRLRPDATMS
jgi:hypothetical protein